MHRSLPVVALNCNKKVDCTDPSHVAEVNLCYENLISSIKSADTEANLQMNAMAGGIKLITVVPDGVGLWTDYVDELHQSARECVLFKYGVIRESHGRVRYLT